MKIESFADLIASLIIPGDTEKGILSGSEVDFFEFLQNHNKSHLLLQYMENITKSYEEEYQKQILDCDEREIKEYILFSKRKNFRLLNDISVLLCECYYTNTSALKALNLPIDPPFPEGNILNEIDFTLLEGVYNRGSIYRKS